MRYDVVGIDEFAEFLGFALWVRMLAPRWPPLKLGETTGLAALIVRSMREQMFR